MIMICLGLLFLVGAALGCGSTRFDVRDFGGVGDGVALNTAAFRAAVESASRSGGRVFVTNGTYVTGTIMLLSNVCLEVDSGARVLASDDPREYKCMPSITWDSGACNYPLVGSVNATNIGLLGDGIINGGANDPPGHLVERYDQETNFLTPKEWLFPGCVGYACRPKIAVFRGSTNITLDAIQLWNSPFWTLSFELCRNVTVRQVQIHGDRRWPNNDGVDIIGSSDILIEHANISAGDDAIAVITHSQDSIENVRVINCTLQSSSAAIKLSSFDADASGEISDIFVSDVRIADTNRGIAIMPRWGATSIRRVRFENLSISTKFFSLPWWGSAEPIYVTLTNFSLTQHCTGTMSDIMFDNVTAVSENGVVLYSAGPYLSNIRLLNVNVTIARWGNISRPSLDLRPSPEPQIIPVNISAFYEQHLRQPVLSGCRAAFVRPCQSFYGPCLRAVDCLNEEHPSFMCSTCS